jgi:hypothetical protein
LINLIKKGRTIMKNLKITMAALLAGAFAFSPFAANALVTAQDVQNSDKAEGLKVRSLEEAEQLAKAINGIQQGGDSILAQYTVCYLKDAYVEDAGNPQAGGDFDDVSEVEGPPDSGGLDHNNGYSLGVNGVMVGRFLDPIPIEDESVRLSLWEIGARREKVQIEIGNSGPGGPFNGIGNPVITIAETLPNQSISISLDSFFNPGQFPDEQDNMTFNAVRITDIDEDFNDKDDENPEPLTSDIAYGADIDAVGVECEEFDDNAITLKSLETSAEDGKNVVKFETAREKDSMGMKVFRINVKDIEEVEAVSPQGSPTSGSEYVVEDTKVKSGDTYIYLMQELDASGAVTVYPENTNEIEPVTAK